jgi:hypothetical protein
MPSKRDAERLLKQLEDVRRSDPTLEHRLHAYRERRQAYRTFRDGKPPTPKPEREAARKYRV